jgi:hypothetical protein
VGGDNGREEEPGEGTEAIRINSSTELGTGCPFEVKPCATASNVGLSILENLLESKADKALLSYLFQARKSTQTKRRSRFRFAIASYTNELILHSTLYDGSLPHSFNKAYGKENKKETLHILFFSLPPPSNTRLLGNDARDPSSKCVCEFARGCHVKIRARSRS